MSNETPLLSELAQIKVTLAALLNLVEGQRTRKDWYTTEEVGEILDRDPHGEGVGPAGPHPGREAGRWPRPCERVGHLARRT